MVEQTLETLTVDTRPTSEENTISENKIVEKIKDTVKVHNSEHNTFFIKCHKVLQKYPPAKNEYKFIYGKLVEMALIDMLNSIFHECKDLDSMCDNGSSYKNDCVLYFTDDVYTNISIKAKKNRKTGNVIMINKNSNNKQYDLTNLLSIIVVIETNDLFIIPHNRIPEKYIENNESNISYKSSLFTYLYKPEQYEKYIVHLEENEEYKRFCEEVLPTMTSYDIYGALYNSL